MPYIVQDSASGAKTLIFRGERDVRIHSAFDPLRDAERAVASFDPAKKGIIVVLGLGLGYHLRLLSDRFPDRTVIAIEHDRELVDIVRRECPENLSGAAVICDENDLPSIFEQFDVSSFRGFALFTHRPSYSLSSVFYDTIVTEMNRYVSSKISDLLTRFEFEEKWAVNILSNLPMVFKESCVGDFFGAFKGRPGIIVSAGPSLKKNAALLAELSDKALITCVDTPFKVLFKMGISPHIVMSLDAQKYSVRHFLGIADTRPYLLSDLVSCPKVGAIYKGRVIASTTSKYYDNAQGTVSRETTPLVDWIERYVPQIGDVQSGGSVATSLFDFLLNAGCDPIILVGQDLAYTGREIHTSGTYHNDEWLTMTSRILNLDTINQRVVRKRKISYVPAWGGREDVITDFVLSIYRQWFEDSCKKVPVRVINATEGGARIDGADEMTLRQAADLITASNVSPRTVLDAIYDSRTLKNSTAFLEAARHAVTKFEHLKTFSGKEDSPEAERAARNSLADKDLPMIFSPFLKKTNAYLNRHPDMDEHKAFTLITRDIIRASAILSKIVPDCISAIESDHK